jgi:hypothetical protein
MRGFLSNVFALFSAFAEPIIIACIGGIAYGASLIFLPAGIIVGCVLIALAAVDSGRP